MHRWSLPARRHARVAAAFLLLAAATPAAAGPATGRPAPPFTAESLDGGELSLDDLRGSVVLLNFWSPTCPPCAIEMPELQRLHEKYSDRGLRVVGVTQMDPSREVIRRFLEDKKVSYPIVLDPGEEIGRRYELEAHPTSVFIDEEGLVRKIVVGYVRGDEEEIEDAIRSLLP